MEIKIGVRSVLRELIVETDLTAEQIEQTLVKAMSEEHGVFALTDEKGRRVLVPVAQLGYVEIGESEPRSVGFGTL